MSQLQPQLHLGIYLHSIVVPHCSQCAHFLVVTSFTSPLFSLTSASINHSLIASSLVFYNTRVQNLGKLMCSFTIPERQDKYTNNKLFSVCFSGHVLLSLIGSLQNESSPNLCCKIKNKIKYSKLKF